MMLEGGKAANRRHRNKEDRKQGGKGGRNEVCMCAVVVGWKGGRAKCSACSPYVQASANAAGGASRHTSSSALLPLLLPYTLNRTSTITSTEQPSCSPSHAHTPCQSTARSKGGFIHQGVLSGHARALSDVYQPLHDGCTAACRCCWSASNRLRPGWRAAAGYRQGSRRPA